MRRLDHPHVLKLKDVNWSAQYPKKRGGFREDIMLVLQLADGGELFSYLMHTGKFPETISRTFFQQMCDGLAYCHKEGVSHRDIKPENLLLTANFQLLLADFGLSSLKETETETADASGAHLLKTLCGTPQYMAPELNRNERYDGRAVDVWAAGVVLFIMHTGFPPLGEAIRGDWYYDRMRKNQMATFWKAHERSAQFSDSFKDLIEKIFVPDPAGRISIDEVKQHPWYTGEVVSQEVLSGELRRRKQQVAAAKRAERRKKQEEAAGRRGNFEEANYRAADLDTEAPALPASVALLPAFGMKRLIHSKLHEGHLVEAANTAFLDLQAKYKLPAGAAAGGGAAEGDAGDEAGAGAAEAAPAAAAAAEEPKVEFTAKKGEFKFKAAFPVSASESLKVSLQIFRQSKDMRAICLKRETGPMMKVRVVRGGGGMHRVRVE